MIEIEKKLFVCTIRTLIKIVFFISIRNGAERSGLYCLCSIAIDRIKSDGTVAMPLMLNHLRSRRKQLVPYFVSCTILHNKPCFFFPLYVYIDRTVKKNKRIARYNELGENIKVNQ